MTADSVESTASQFVVVDGVRLRVRTAGKGRPLLLIMGVGGNIEMWHPFDEELQARGIQTISFDAPGTGDSGELDRPRRMPWLAGMVTHLLDRLGHAQVDVLGISWGGALAQEVAHRAPERVRRLVLAATAAGVPVLGGVPGKPGAMIRLVTPRRYRDPDYFASEAEHLYGGTRFGLPDGHLAARLASLRHPAGTCISSGPSRRGPRCRGCGASRSLRSCSPATMTRSCRWPTDVSSGG